MYYFGIQLLGVPNETYGTWIWSFELAGISFSLWQEYALFFTLPMSLVGFLIGNQFGVDRAGLVGEPNAQEALE